ncbi:MAG: fluoride efflux transporter CrcB [Planctomycetaceae bacterium]
MLTQITLVGFGGFLGSVGRYLLSLLVTQWSGASRFPAATLVVNVIGCLAIGALSGFATRSEFLTPALRLFLITGLLGGFTTFSAFGYETFLLGRDALGGIAFANIAAQLLLGLGAVWLGHTVALSGH